MSSTSARRDSADREAGPSTGTTAPNLRCPLARLRQLALPVVPKRRHVRDSEPIVASEIETTNDSTNVAISLQLKSPVLSAICLKAHVSAARS